MCETGNKGYNLASIDPTSGNCGQVSTDEKQSNTNGTKHWEGDRTEGYIGEQEITAQTVAFNAFQNLDLL